MGQFRLTRVLPRSYVVQYGRPPVPGRPGYCITLPSTTEETATRPNSSIIVGSSSNGGRTRPTIGGGFGTTGTDSGFQP
jgi:hypothetical protein